MNPYYPLVARRAGYRCEYCLAPEALFNFPFEVEHIVPSSRQGPDDDSNLALACRACNVRKSNQIEGYDEISQSLTRLYHPRQDPWEAHFQFDGNAGAIQGITAIGRVTVALLQMNSRIQMDARRQWMRLGLFP